MVWSLIWWVICGIGFGLYLFPIQADLEILIHNVLDLWSIFDPSRIQYKYKLHVLSHIKEDIRRFGPAILFATEIFECWNVVFRLCSILSNHQAPSCDIANTLADMERFKHQVSGGWWKTTAGYVQAGSNIRNFLLRHRELQRRLGWMDMDQLAPGIHLLILILWVSNHQLTFIRNYQSTCKI